jgi:tRNA A-37 threonylcarbamoyl transferase component Bud32
MGAVLSGSTFDPGEPSELPPRDIVGFELVDRLGRDRFTSTYRVRRASSTYAVRLLTRGARDERSEQHFRRMAALLAAVDHPGLVRVHASGEGDDGRPYVVTDLVEGRSLAAVLGGGRLAVHDTIRLGIDVASALSAAHQARLVHGDLSPANIVINAVGDARVVDFGLPAGPGVTVAGAPELVILADHDVDGRADLYALGRVLYECVIGRPPLLDDDPSPAWPRPGDVHNIRPELPPALSRIIAKLLAPNPDDRYQYADGLLADLRRLAGGSDWDFTIGEADWSSARPDPPLLGRDDEIATLLDCWERARDGVGGVALAYGPAGSGKTRLSDEVVAAIRLGGGLVLAGECEPDDGVPLGPLRRAIDDHLRAVAGRPAPEYLSALAKVRTAAGSGASLLRGLTLSLDDVLDAPALAEDDRHQQVLIAVADFLASLATAHGGAVLYLDDVQWLDPATQRVLQQLAEKLTEVPLLVLLAGRDDARSRTTMAELGSALVRAAPLEVRLRPLPVDVLAKLVSAVTGGLTVDPATAASLAARSGGNIFILLQYLDALIDAGLLRPDWGRWLLDTEAARKLVPTDDGVGLILRRLDGLDADSRSVLGVAAVHGSVFDYHLIADACALPRHRVLDVADTAAWRDLVERRPDGRYAFRHDRIREALVGQYEPDALRGVHQRLADALAHTLAGAVGSDAQAVFALARHCALGEPLADPHRAVRACTAAGRLALANHAPAEAIRHLELAQQIAQAGNLCVNSAFLTALATAQQRAGHFQSAALTARAGLDQTFDPIGRARLLRLIAQAEGTAWEGARESGSIQAALRELGREPARRLSLLVPTSLGTFLLGQLIRLTRVGYGTAHGRTRDACRLEAALYLAALRSYGVQYKPLRALLCLLRQTYPVMRIGPGPELAQWRAALGFVDLAIGLRRTGRRHAEQAVVLASATGDPSLTSLMRWMAAFNKHTFGIDQGEALRQVLDQDSRWLELGMLNDLILILLWDALHRGDVAAAQQLADHREALIRSTGDHHTGATSGIQSATVARAALAALSAWQDRPEEADTWLDYSGDGRRLRRTERLPLCGAAMVVAYQRYELDETFDRAVAEFDALNLPSRTLLTVADGFHFYRARGRIEQYRLATGADRPRRRRQARAALRVVDRIAGTQLLKAHVEVVRAALLQAAGKPRAALRQLDRRQAVVHAVDAPWVAFEAARVRALALRDLGDPEPAADQAQLALAIARQQDWPQHARRISADFDLPADAATAR